ncbi:aldehyde dehydrogenase [Amycolatopsis thermoflava]|uniref:aldehyde dehydrogenase n=1 Tax=Amycolatopsis thermoflava TaxID=84480 RepID=UPI0037F88F38
MTDQRNEPRLAHTDKLYIDGAWRTPSSRSTFQVVDSATERPYFSVAAAGKQDVDAAIGAARAAFDSGPWPRMTPLERAGYLSRLAEGLRERADEMAELWTRETGAIHAVTTAGSQGTPAMYDYYAGLAETYPFDEAIKPTSGGEFGLLVKEPVGVVAAIIPWNSPQVQIALKLAPALLGGSTVILKASPQAPGETYLVAEVADEIGFPPGVINVVTADAEVSELLVADPRVDKISFTGSTAAGRRIASLAGGRIARYTLELGGKSAALVLDDYDLATAAGTLAGSACMISGQVCTTLSRVIVERSRHDELVEALAAAFASVRVGDPFDAATGLGPVATAAQRERIEGYIAKGIADGATLATGGGRPAGLDRGWFVEPTVFGNVDNSSVIAQEEIFGPVLAVIPADDEEDAIRLANESIYGLNASVFTNDTDRALAVARRLRSGTVGHNAWRSDPGVSFGGFKQSGVGREGGIDGLEIYLEKKYVVLDGVPDGHSPHD